MNDLCSNFNITMYYYIFNTLQLLAFYFYTVSEKQKVLINQFVYV